MEKIKKLKDFKKFIIVDAETGRPMAWSEDQLCFCTSEIWEDEHHPVELYSYSVAKRLIADSKEYRRKRKFSVSDYLLVPVNIKAK